jgi:hypothetical protein
MNPIQWRGPQALSEPAWTQAAWSAPAWQPTPLAWTPTPSWTGPIATSPAVYVPGHDRKDITTGIIVVICLVSVLIGVPILATVGMCFRHCFKGCLSRADKKKIRAVLNIEDIEMLAADRKPKGNDRANITRPQATYQPPRGTYKGAAPIRPTGSRNPLTGTWHAYGAEQEEHYIPPA